MEHERHKELSLIVHELRSPVAVVGGYLRLLLQSDLEAFSDRQRKMLEEANSSCARVFRLIQEISDLAFDGDRSDQLSEVPVFALFRDLLASSSPPDDPVAGFVCAASDLSVVVTGDALKLKQAFAALVAMVSREHRGDRLKACGFVHAEEQRRVAVIALGGDGLAGDHNQVLTKRIELDRYRGGNGLSVPLACQTIEAHGGRVWTVSDGAPSVIAWSLPMGTPVLPAPGRP